MDLIIEYSPRIVEGAWVTLQLAFCGLFLGLALGLVTALAESVHWWLVRYPVTLSVTVIRGLPELLIVFFIYFGIGRYLAMSHFSAGVLALGIIFAAYASQTLRGAFATIPKGQAEAAQALGLSQWQTFSRITLPQIWQHALPGLGNLWFILLKDTALVSLIGLTDLMTYTELAARATREPFTFYLIAALIYLLFTTLSMVMLNYWIKRSRRYLAR